MLQRASAKQEGIKVSTMIRKLKSGQYRLYSRKIGSKTGKRRNIGTFPTRAKAEQHERAVQYSNAVPEPQVFVGCSAAETRQVQ